MNPGTLVLRGIVKVRALALAALPKKLGLAIHSLSAN